VFVYAAIKRVALTADSHLMCGNQPQLMVVLTGTLSATVTAGDRFLPQRPPPHAARQLALVAHLHGREQGQRLTIVPIAANISIT
jgi:hypothetical protein